MKKQKILLVIKTLEGGGAERSVLTLGQGFYDLGYEVHIIRFRDVVAYDLPKELNYHLFDYNKFRVLPKNQIRYKVVAKFLDRYIKKNIGVPLLTLSNLDRADEVMCHSSLPNVLHIIRNTISKKMARSKKPKDKLIQELRGIYTKHPCICVSQGVENDIIEMLGDDIKTQTIYNSFDKPLIQTMAAEHINLNEYGLKANEYVVHAGRFNYQKAHDVLLKAYAKSPQTYPLVMLGQGGLLEETKTLAQDLGIEDRVKFIGFHKNPYPFIKQARCFVLSSRYEGFVRVVAEALSLQTPVVSTDCPSGPSEMLPAFNLVPVDDVHALADKLNDCMQNPEHYRVSLDDKFLPINIAQQYIDFIEKYSN